MKKTLFIAIACVFALVGCTKFEKDPQFVPVQTGAPVISDTDSTETSLTAVITPADANTAYYSYVLLLGGKQALAAEDVLTGNVKAALLAGSAEAAVEPSILVKTDSVWVGAKFQPLTLEKGETYTLYAVAASKTGTVSAVSTHMFILDDQKAPSFKVANVVCEIEDSVVTISIPFDRNLKLGQDAKITVHGWGIMSDYEVSTIESIKGKKVLKQPIMTATLGGDTLSVKENCLEAFLPKEAYTPGMVLTFVWDAGTVISLPVSEGGHADIPCKKYSTEFVEYAKGIISGLGVGIQYPADILKLAPSPLNPKYINYKNWELEKFKLGAEVPTFFQLLPAPLRNTIEYVEEYNTQAIYTKNHVVKVAEVGKANTTVELDSITFTLPEQPEKLQYAGFHVPAGTVFDIFGNTNVDTVIDSVICVDGTLDFAYSETEAGCNLISTKITPGAQGLTFFADYYEGTKADSSDVNLIKNAKDYIGKIAEIQQSTFSDIYLKYFAYASEDYVYDINLEPEKTYTFYAFYMTADGTVLSDVYKQEVTTAQFVLPTETTGTFTYVTSPFAALGEKTGTPVSINATKDTITISNFGSNGVDLKCAVDKSGNIKVVKTPVMNSKYGLVYINEIEDWYQTFYGKSYGSTSYYNSLDKTIYFNIVYHIASGGYFGVGEYSDTFCFDNSQPAPAPTSVKFSDTKFTPSKGKIAKPIRRHVK